MFYRFAVCAMRVLEFAFFAGLIGCALAVVFSWISIFSDGFSSKDDHPKGK